MKLTPNQPVLREAVERPDLLDARSPHGLRLVQITTDPAVASGHIYMEAPVFTPDSRRFVYHRIWIDDPSADTRFWRRQFWLCDIDDGFALRQLTDDLDATAPAVTADGRWLYYAITCHDVASRRGIRLMRCELDSGRNEVVMVLDKPLSGCHAPPSKVYPLGTVRSDGGAYACGVFIGDGVHPGRWALMVIDLIRHQASIAIESDHLINPHPQYSRSRDPEHFRDLLVQENLLVRSNARGERVHVGSGCLLYVIRDDGTNLRVIPTGDEHELNHGHQEWRGERTSVIVGVDHRHPGTPHTRPCIEATPVAVADRRDRAPRRMPAAQRHRNDITRNLSGVAFGHTAFDLSGNHFVGDWRLATEPGPSADLYLGHLGDEPDAALRVRYLLKPRSSYGRCQSTHPHPFLSPDGRRAFFNSDLEQPHPQIWMIDRLPEWDC
jgi:hypothetical protein